jgi:hypothetical protein
MVSQSFLHYNNPEIIKRYFPKYHPQKSVNGLSSERDGHFPSAIYLKVK